MKKQFISISAVGMALASSLCAQSLFDLAPSGDQQESLPVTWTAGVTFGYDDNPTPLAQNEDEAAFGQAYIGATFLTHTPQSTLSVGAQIGVIHYFDNLDTEDQFGNDIDVDDTTFTASIYANWTYRVSERLRFVSQNNLAYELEPDYTTGFQAQRQTGNYFRYSSSNAIGYRWSERLATYTGISFDGIAFDDFSGGDRSTYTIFNDFRYQLSPQTVATLTYRYSETDGDGSVSDSENQFILVGLEHRFSPSTSGVVRAGVQIRDVDGGNSSSSPYVEASLNSRVNEQFSVRAYARYGVEDYSRSLTNFSEVGNPFSIYSDSDTLRLGISGTYTVSQSLSLVGGVNYTQVGYDNLQEDISGPNSASSVYEDFFNAFVGFDYKLRENLTLNGRYNYEDLSSDAGRDYDRNRYTLGLSTQF